ncbi:hypothetical protein AWU67_12385 [Microterricola viridarii]|uniref:Uncharacterized protein n=1 Tax=Microterricola viridarii TaxID=412690 RepID=A0A0X8E4F5_9MICO|nr:hypothetical protein AWU67_12385 [Microterricola viridarii]
MRQGHVLLDRQPGGQPLAVPILRDVGNTRAQHPPDVRAFERNLGTVNDDRATHAGRGRRDQRAEPGEPRIDAAGEPDHFAALDRRRDIADASAPDAAQLDSAFADLGRHVLREVVELAVAAEHKVRQRSLVEVVGGQPHLDNPTVAQGCDAIGDLQHLGEVVADDDDGSALRREQADHAVEVVERLMWDRSGRLVEDDHAATAFAALQSTRDRYSHALTRSEPGDLGLGVDVPQVEELERLANRRGILRLVDPPREPVGGVPTNAHVLTDRQVGNQPEILVHERQALFMQPCRIDRGADALAVDEDLSPGVGAIHAADELDQRRLARSVLADEGVHLAGANLESCLAQNRDARECLR